MLITPGALAVVIDGPVWVPTAPPGLAEFVAPNLQPIPVLPLIGGVLALAYLWGAVTLWRRKRAWSIVRTISFLLGAGLLVFITGAGIEGYGYAMFSVFVFQQLTLMMVIPPLLIAGSPGTLLLRSAPHSGRWRWIRGGALSALRSRLARFLVHPGLVVPLLLLSYLGLYLTGVANFFLQTWAGHVGLEIIFLTVGIIIAVPLISADPLPRRPSFVVRLFDTVGEMQIHAIFGLVMIFSAVAVIPVFADPPAAWNVDPVIDQSLAGVLAWTYGELPLLVILIVTLSRWQRQDTVRSAKNRQREDDELDAYNDYLQRIQK